MQRSIGKKILAVAAGVGVAAGGLMASAPAVQAATNTQTVWYVEWNMTITPPGQSVACGSGSGLTYQAAYSAAAKACEANVFALVDSGVTGVKMDGQPSNVYTKEETIISGPGVEIDDDLGDLVDPEVIVEPSPPPPPPCWDPSINNCPVGGALQVAVPQYMIAGVPQQLVAYAAWRPDENTSGAPSNGDAVISMNGEPIAAAPFADGKATFTFTPMEPGVKDVTISGVLNSNTSGANAWIDSVRVSTMVLPYDPELLEEALKNAKVEVGDTYTLEEVAQAKTALGKRLEWRVAQDSSDVCAITTTKKGEVRAKFTESGKCSIIWTDPKKDEEGKYTFKVTA